MMRNKQVEKADRFGDIDRIGSADDIQPGEPEFSVNERPGNDNMEDVHQENRGHGNPGLAPAVHDPGEDIQPGGKAEIEKNKPDILVGIGHDIRAGTHKQRYPAPETGAAERLRQQSWHSR